MRRLALTFALIGLLFPVSAFAEQQPAYAAQDDLWLAARCSVLKFVIDARAHNIRITAADGQISFVNEIAQNQTLSAGMTVPFNLVEIAPEGKLSTSKLKRITAKKDLGVDVNQRGFPVTCTQLRVRTLDSRGRKAASRGALLFDFPSIVRTYKPCMNNGQVIIAEQFGRGREAKAKTGFNFLGLLKAGHEAAVSDSNTSGFEVTFTFASGTTNCNGVRYKPKKTGGQA